LAAVTDLLVEQGRAAALSNAGEQTPSPLVGSPDISRGLASSDAGTYMNKMSGIGAAGWGKSEEV